MSTFAIVTTNAFNTSPVDFKTQHCRL